MYRVIVYGSCSLSAPPYRAISHCGILLRYLSVCMCKVLTHPYASGWVGGYALGLRLLRAAALAALRSMDCISRYAMTLSSSIPVACLPMLDAETQVSPRFSVTSSALVRDVTMRADRRLSITESLKNMIYLLWLGCWLIAILLAIGCVWLLVSGLKSKGCFL